MPSMVTVPLSDLRDISMFERTTEFITAYPQYVVANNAMGFLSDDGGKTYNMCHCTSLALQFVIIIVSL